MRYDDWGTITRPSRKFCAEVQYRPDGRFGPVKRETITVRHEDPKTAVATLGRMAELRHGTDYVISLLYEDIGDIPFPVRFD